MRHNPSWADQMTTCMSIEQAMKTHDLALQAANRSASLRDGYRLAGERFIAYLTEHGIAVPAIDALTPDHVRGFSLHLRATPTVSPGRVRQKGPRTIQAHVVSLKGLGHFLVDEGVLDHDPLRSLRLPKAPAKAVMPFTSEELRLLLSAIPLRPMETRNRAILYFMLATGVRASELCGLTLDNLDIKSGAAQIVLGKGMKNRGVRFDRTTGRYLALYLAERPNTAAGKRRVFVTHSGKPVTRGALYQMIAKVGVDAGVENAHPHRLRHTWATAFLEAHPGALFHLQEQLGHTSLEMSHRYAKVARGREQLDGPDVVDILGLNGRHR